MSEDTDDIQARHERVMQNHARFVRNQRFIFTFLMAFLLGAMLYGLQALMTGEAVVRTAEEAQNHLEFTVALYSVLTLLLVAHSALALRSRAKIIELFIDHFNTSYELGKLTARLEDAGNANPSSDPS